MHSPANYPARFFQHFNTFFIAMVYNGGGAVCYMTTKRGGGGVLQWKKPETYTENKF